MLENEDVQSKPGDFTRADVFIILPSDFDNFRFGYARRSNFLFYHSLLLLHGIVARIARKETGPFCS